MGNNLSLDRVERVLNAYQTFVKLLPLCCSSVLSNCNRTLSPIVTTCDGRSVTKNNTYGPKELTELGAPAFDFISTNCVLPVNIASSLVILSEQTEEQQHKWLTEQLEYKLNEIITQAKQARTDAINMKSTAETTTPDEATTGLAAAENTFKKAWDNVSKATSDIRITENKLNAVLCDKTATSVDSDHACAEHREASKTMNMANVALASARGALDVSRQLMNPKKVITDCENRICAMNSVIVRVSKVLELLKIE